MPPETSLLNYLQTNPSELKVALAWICIFFEVFFTIMMYAASSYQNILDGVSIQKRTCMQQTLQPQQRPNTIADI